MRVQSQWVPFQPEGGAAGAAKAKSVGKTVKASTANCATGEGEILIAVNAASNPRKRPAGSGFWLAAVDKIARGATDDQKH